MTHQCCIEHSGPVKTTFARRFQNVLRIFSVLATCPSDRSNALFLPSTIVITPPLFDPEQYFGLLQVFPKPFRYYVVHTFEDFEETLRNSVLGRLDYQSVCSHCSVILME